MMTPKERWLAALRLQPVDRLPFWPKFDGAYPLSQAAPFREMGNDALHAWVGSDRHVWVGNGLREVRTCTAVESTTAGGVMRTVYRTPHGELEEVQHFDEGSQAWHPVNFPVRTVDDIKIMTEVFEDVSVEVDLEALAEARARVASFGQDAVIASAIGTSALMQWVQALAGVEMAHYLLLDYPEEVEALFAAMHRDLRRRAELLAEYSPADILYLVENTSTTLVSPEQYRQYWFPQIREYAGITHAAGRILTMHMCGHLKALLPDLAQVPAQAFEAFTSPTVGNTTLLDGRTACPDKCLIGGTNASLWLEPAAAIIAQIERDLDALPHHRGIVVTSAGVMPPRCAPETVRAVCAWLKGYPARP
ncbi:MAG: uroporphyrinogen decarboxylase family protein [Armatimonadota bacterium]